MEGKKGKFRDLKNRRAKDKYPVNFETISTEEKNERAKKRSTVATEGRKNHLHKIQKATHISKSKTELKPCKKQEQPKEYG